MGKHQCTHLGSRFSVILPAIACQGALGRYCRSNFRPYSKLPSPTSLASHRATNTVPFHDTICHHGISNRPKSFAEPSYRMQPITTPSMGCPHLNSSPLSSRRAARFDNGQYADARFD